MPQKKLLIVITVNASAKNMKSDLSIIIRNKMDWLCAVQRQKADKI